MAKKPKKPKEKGSKTWKLVGTASALFAGRLATKGLDATWRTATGHNPPNKPEHPELSQREAMAWAAVSGMAIGVAKAYATRRAANYWVKSFGKLPPGTSGDVYKPAPNAAKATGRAKARAKR
ncbi:MAG: DUF4235 domain-containing protein [Nocardioidaceae bacterium]